MAIDPTEHLGLVHAIANGHRGVSDFDEMVADGYLGLVEAARRYDDTCGTTFATFARHRIRGAIIDGLRRRNILSGTATPYRRGKPVPFPLSLEVNVTPDAGEEPMTLADTVPGGDDPTKRVLDAAALADLERRISWLTVARPYSAEAVALTRTGMTQTEAAERLGVTGGAICQRLRAVRRYLEAA